MGTLVWTLALSLQSPDCGTPERKTQAHLASSPGHLANLFPLILRAPERLSWVVCEATYRHLSVVVVFGLSKQKQFFDGYTGALCIFVSPGECF